MQLTSIATFLLFAVYTAAVDVACQVNGVTVAVVDLDTGVCPFTIPDTYPVLFNFNSLEDYDAIFYYATVNSVKFYTEITAAGRTIEIGASLLFGSSVPFFQVEMHLHETNSTAAIRRRLLKQVEVEKRAPIDDFLALAYAQEGTAIEGSVFAVVLADSASSSSTVPPSGDISTATVTHTTTAVITTCSDNACGVTSVPVVPTVTTETKDGVVTVYTTYCPETTVITITSCSDNKCSTHTGPATHILTSGTIHGVETEYYTICPLTESTKVVTSLHDVTYTTESTVTKCSDVCHTTTYPVTTVVPETTVVTLTTWKPAVDSTSTMAPTTVAPVTTSATSSISPSVTTYEGMGARAGLSLAAILPFLGFMV